MTGWEPMILTYRSDYNNDNLLQGATRYYYSESKPTSTGDYWHYDESGNIAVW